MRNLEAWKLGYDIGYGFGWKLQAGSLIPTSSGGVSHYIFTDATGAEYDLNVQTGGVWTSAEGIHATFDPNTARLKFNDGSFWVMGCVAAAAEADAGTMYPTLMQDSNGNQVIIRYLAGAGVSWSNSSGRIQEIEDVRATWQGAGYATYKFTYSNGRLTGISNTIGSGETYTFYSETGQSLVSPFDGTSQGQTGYLRWVEVTGLGKRHTFSTGSSGQLTRVTFPYGGYLGWDYTNYEYLNSRFQPEVRYRKLSKDGLSEVSYTLDREDDRSRPVHWKAMLYDPNGTSNKYWEFATSGTFIGLASSHSKRESAVALSSETYTWTMGGSGPYISEVLSQLGAVKKKTQQTIDSYGNVTQVKQYDWGVANGAPGALLKTTDYGYLAPPTGNPYVRNRIVYADVTGTGFTAARLFQNTYDVYGTIADLPQVRQHDAAVGTSYQARGNVTSRTDPNGQTLMNYDIGGNVVWSRGPTGTQGNVSYQSGTNFAAPSALTVGSLMESLAYSTFGAPSSVTGPNGEVAGTSYDSYGRISGTTTATGVSTTYSYSTSAPWTVTATTGQKWVKQTLDGFGRTVKTETGTGGTTLSVVDTEYDVCACTPTGKVKRTSLPYTGSASVWNRNTYDALGRTTRTTVVLNGTDQEYKEYVYVDNTVTAYDEARKWKKYKFDGLGNLVQVNEPNPADASHDAISVYTYDALGHLTNVDLRRWNAIASVYDHQYRAFTYGMTQLSNATNPESGTVNYGYANGLLSWKTDAKGGKIEYSYDSYNRVSQIRHYPAEYPFSGVGEDTCQRVDLTYDSNPDSGFTYLAGRLATRTYSVCVQPNGGAGASAKTTFTESYGYTQGGQPLRKRLRVSRQLTNQYQQTVTVQRDLDGSWSYTAGKMTSVTYPAGSSGPGAGTYTVGYDSMDRPNTLNDGVGPAVVSGVSYGVAGQLVTVSGLYTESRSYDERLRLTGVNGATFTYKVNGRIETETVGIEQITYQYDALNRLISSSSNQGWSQGYNYDGYGNLVAKTGVNAPAFTAGYDLNNRQIGFTFDADGNQLLDLQGVSASYDVENRIAWATKVGTAVGNGYGYDPDNRRVYFSKWGFDQSAGEWRVTAGGGYEEVVYYGVTGQRMGSYRLSADLNGLYLAATGYNVWFGSRLVRKVAQDGTNTTVQADRLGSFGKYFAYGEQRGTLSSDNTEKFATYYRDGDTGLDYAVNRYYASGWGRFLSPDPYRANSGGPGDVGDPGSWNRYGYVGGDPARFIDPEGLTTCVFDSKLGIVCRDSVDVVEKVTDIPLPSPPASSPPNSPYSADLIGRLVSSRNGTIAVNLSQKVYWGQLTDCQALAQFADDVAALKVSAQAFVAAFGVLTPDRDRSALVRLFGDFIGVQSGSKGWIQFQPNNALSSGFANQFRDTISPNADQGHHFSAFFQLGASQGSFFGSIAAWGVELENLLLNGGDINLAEAAVRLGADVSSGRLSMTEVGNRIRSELCAH